MSTLYHHRKTSLPSLKNRIGEKVTNNEVIIALQKAKWLPLEVVNFKRGVLWSTGYAFGKSQVWGIVASKSTSHSLERELIDSYG